MSWALHGGKSTPHIGAGSSLEPHPLLEPPGGRAAPSPQFKAVQMEVVSEAPSLRAPSWNCLGVRGMPGGRAGRRWLRKDTPRPVYYSHETLVIVHLPNELHVL